MLIVVNGLETLSFLNPVRIVLFAGSQVLSKYYLCSFSFYSMPLFLEGEKKRERENNGGKKMYGVPFSFNTNIY